MLKDTFEKTLSMDEIDRRFWKAIERERAIYFSSLKVDNSKQELKDEDTN